MKGRCGIDAERWFLVRGLPAVLPARARWVDGWPRSAPAITAYAAVICALLVVYLLLGTSEIYIDGAPTRVERIVLAVIGLAVPVGAVLGRLVARLPRRAQSLVGAGAAVVAAVASAIQGGIPHLAVTLAVVVLIVGLTGTGVGAVLAWATRLTVGQVRAMGRLFVRALPVLLLTVVVFFNTYAWLMADTISQARLMLALTLLLAVTAAFIVSATIGRVKPLLESHPRLGDAHPMAGTPFEDLSEPAARRPLSRGERLNVVVVLAAAQLSHLLLVAISTAAIYFVLGLVLLSPEVLAKWTGNGASDGALLGMTIPVPQSLLNMTFILCVLTFMYVSARSVGDDEFEKDFLDPLIEDLHVTLVGRNRYGGTPAV